MLFTTLGFVFVFLPIVLLIYLVLMRFRLTAYAFPWLGLASKLHEITLNFNGWQEIVGVNLALLMRRLQPISDCF